MAHVGLATTEERIAAACLRSGRDRNEVALVVVSKNQPDDAVREVYDGGQRVFAENREQGLRTRIESDLPSDIEWHFVGPLQTRKAAFVGPNVALLQSMDRMRLAERWVQRSDAPVLVQFNLGEEEQKSGFLVRDADQTYEALTQAGLTIRGVMAIPPFHEDPELVRPYFAELRRVFDRYQDFDASIDVCSMGMTNDLEVAIEEGATMVRVGRAIFA